MKLTPEQLLRIAPAAGSKAAAIAAALTMAMPRYGITTPERAAPFLGNLAHESGQFIRARENLNYQASTLLRVWPSRFLTEDMAKRYAHMPEDIANLVYANRMGNGDVKSGDGYRYRGAGWIQLTGKENHLAAALEFDIDPEQIGDWLCTPEGAALSAAWYWKNAGCNAYADKGNHDAIADLINIGRRTARVGDAIGYEERLMLTKRSAVVLA
jgi:putative chitinase